MRRRIPIRAAAALTAALLLAPSAPALASSGHFEAEAEAVRTCDVHPDLTAAPSARPPAELMNALELALDDERLDDAGLGLSVWIEGYGEVLAVNADLRLRPASNQKLLTAMGAFEILGGDSVLTTTLATDGLVANGVLDGNLYLVGGGDPTLTATGAHSLEALATAVREAGITRIEGAVIADESRYDALRVANGWRSIPIPAWVGSLSALLVDENRWSADWAFIADPATSNGQRFAGQLRSAGVSIGAGVETGAAPASAATVAQVSSAPIRDLVRVMLEDSNNTYAEVLVKEMGYRAAGTGSTAAGMAALTQVVEDLCQPRSILQQDGSGLSHGNARSAHGWRRLLQAAQVRAWWPEFVDAMAIAGETGTILNRFVGTAAEGNLKAKTGSINGLRALSGIMTTAGERRVFFSAIVDADEPRSPLAAVDDLLVVIAEDES